MLHHHHHHLYIVEKVNVLLNTLAHVVNHVSQLPKLYQPSHLLCGLDLGHVQKFRKKKQLKYDWSKTQNDALFPEA